jgi:toxin YoeB
VNWTLVFTSQAKKDAKKLASSGLKAQAQRLLDVLAVNPYE